MWIKLELLLVGAAAAAATENPICAKCVSYVENYFENDMTEKYSYYECVFWFFFSVLENNQNEIVTETLNLNEWIISSKLCNLSYPVHSICR